MMTENESRKCVYIVLFLDMMTENESRKCILCISLDMITENESRKCILCNVYFFRYDDWKWK
jgi:hypothetical protein